MEYNGFSLSLSCFNGHFPGGFGLGQYQNVSILDFIGAKGDGGGGNNCSYKTCKAPVKMLPTKNIQFFYRPDALPVPNQQCQSTEGHRIQWSLVAKPKLN